MSAAIIVAAADNDVVGVDGDLPWRIREDLAHFKRLTMGHALIVGRVTYESILRTNGGPLAGRFTIVVTRGDSVRPDDEVVLVSKLEIALELAEACRVAQDQEHFFIGGGAQVYEQALPHVDRVFLTRVPGTPAGDARMPAGWLDGFREVSVDELTDESGELVCSFRELVRVS
jgi:dihydrofolate reductase